MTSCIRGTHVANYEFAIVLEGRHKFEKPVWGVEFMKNYTD